MALKVRFETRKKDGGPMDGVGHSAVVTGPGGFRARIDAAFRFHGAPMSHRSSICYIAGPYRGHLNAVYRISERDGSVRVARPPYIKEMIARADGLLVQWGEGEKRLFRDRDFVALRPEAPRAARKVAAPR